MLHRYETTTNLYADHDSMVFFGGSDDRLSFIRSSNETVIATGSDQTVSLQTNGPTWIVDHGQGLNLMLGITTANVSVLDFQRDLTAHLTLVGEAAALSPDGNGGTLATLRLAGYPNGGVMATVDFVGDRHLTMAQITQT